MNSSEIHKCVIHPAIGIARVGNAPISEYFIGPERPMAPSSPESGGKTENLEIRRQAARFRVYAYNEAEELLGELDASTGARVEWTVHLVNSKAVSPTTSPNSLNGQPRNNNVTGDARMSLVIDPGPRTVAKPGESALFDSGTFTYPGFSPVKVPLGGMHADKDGRLVVVAAEGKSASPNPESFITSFYNNPSWYDDVADGPVNAKVHIDGRNFEAEGAWVLSAPPDYAGFVDTPQSLYDHLIATHWPPPPGQPGNGGQPSYTHDVYPILKRAAGLKWTRESQEPTALDLNTAYNADEDMRLKIADQIRVLPGGVSSVQNNVLAMWVAGNFIRDWEGPWSPLLPPFLPPPPITPEGLDRAALEACVGAPFFPGIEAGVWVNEPEHFRARLRIRAQAGDVTQRMALPWQADFYACSGDYWWPAQRPNSVIVPPGQAKQSWSRGVESMAAMVTEWTKLGFIVPRGDEQVEAQRYFDNIVWADRIAERLNANGLDRERWLPIVENMLDVAHSKPHPDNPREYRIGERARALIDELIA
ncbi:MAG: hypothetical protein ETSY1_16760 [Candidatus Entotheonella factor]|uniref:L-lysine 6-oxidase n=1 Tax=Entotheonella factor TaxID=1429438 RepID=W4LMM6_ENTF1|nr:MAG: hypothetical protein ETSY1_16760 [Candidatus Entotheonella factor]